MNILAIGAHPDDIEIGCAGTLINYISKGDKIYLLVLTDGMAEGENSGLRKMEQIESSRIMDAEDIFFGGFTDTFLRADKEMIAFVEDILKKIKPSLIFVNYHDDTHQDHRNLAQGVLSATRYIKNVLFYEVPTTQNFSPTVFADIESSLERKMTCLNAHKSQVTKTNIEGLSIIEIARSSSIFRGIQARVRCAEGFVPLRFFLGS